MSERDQKLCVILGGGGHAAVLIDVINNSNAATIHAVLDADRSKWGRELQGVPILGGDNLLPELRALGVGYYAVGLGSTSDNRRRQRLYEFGLSHRLEPLTVEAVSALCSSHADIGQGSQLFPGSIVNAEATVGVNVIINTGAIVEHHCTIGDHVHVATGARLASTVKVDTGAHIGAGATVKQCISIGEGAVVGAGAVVVKDVRPHTVVTGVPAQPLS
jgi:sugar O-acyltransferase (sialic acid O-acetyltransferase NeuD family)